MEMMEDFLGWQYGKSGEAEKYRGYELDWTEELGIAKTRKDPSSQMGLLTINCTDPMRGKDIMDDQRLKTAVITDVTTEIEATAAMLLAENGYRQRSCPQGKEC